MTTEQDNIECFEAVAAGLLAHFYSNFPRPVMIDAAGFEQRLIEDGILPSHCPWPERPGSPGQTLTSETMKWLIEEGIVRCQGSSRSSFAGAVLTAKGFAALNQPIIDQPEKQTIGRGLKNIGRHTAKAVTESLISGFIQLAIR